jgi:anti-anti-sigma factor
VNTKTRQEIHSPKRATLYVDGRLDAVSAQQVKAELQELAKAGCIELTVCLGDVSFVDSSGLAALVSGLKAVRQCGGTLKLAGLNEQARTVFRLTMLERVFEIYEDVEQAHASFSD